MENGRSSCILLLFHLKSSYHVFIKVNTSFLKTERDAEISLNDKLIAVAYFLKDLSLKFKTDSLLV